jgi:sugar O-acyltransferase (sialic acid O-acetyltransferase NeuD family)
MQRLVIAGAGGFGREVFAMIRDINQVQRTWEVLGFLDDNLASLDGLPLYPPVLGPIDHYRSLQSPHVVCAVANPPVRKQLVERLDAQGARWATIIHPTAGVGLGSTLGKGCIVCVRSIVTVDLRIGNHVHINCLASSGHDTCIGDFCTLSGHVDICGHAILEEGAFLGSHATILPNVRIGAWARVGAGSVVIRDVPPGKTVFGAPARGVFSGRPAASPRCDASKSGTGGLAPAADHPPGP